MNFTLTTALATSHTFGKYCGSDFYQLGSVSLQSSMTQYSLIHFLIMQVLFYFGY